VEVTEQYTSYIINISIDKLLNRIFCQVFYLIGSQHHDRCWIIRRAISILLLLLLLLLIIIIIIIIFTLYLKVSQNYDSCVFWPSNLYAMWKSEQNRCPDVNWFLMHDGSLIQTKTDYITLNFKVNNIYIYNSVTQNRSIAWVLGISCKDWIWN
jgi:hypothetical protein